MKIDPKIYLVLDNCFAIKRWVRPLIWMEAAKELGFKYVSASTDNEIDPLFSTDEYMDEWFREVQTASEKTGIIVPTMYTGYQTYRTVGLAHFYEKMAHHLKENWVCKLIDRAAAAGIKGLGFCFFAFSEEVMQSADEYARMEDRCLSIMAEIGDFAYERDFQVGMEQMYVPYQTPFTIAQSEDYLRRIYTMNGGHPIYITLDTGHMIGQYLYQKPSKDEILKSFERDEPGFWLGTDNCMSLWFKYKESGDFINGTEAILADIESNPRMFAAEEDTDEYTWIKRLAKYSPIIHMQQTDGIIAGHRSFTPGNNKTGIIKGEPFFKAIQESYDDPDEIFTPVDEIYLDFELFFANIAYPHDILSQLKQSLQHWRQFVPEDGMRLSEIVSRL